MASVRNLPRRTAALAALLALGVWTGAAAQPQGEPHRTAALGRLCGATLGLEPGQSQYESCLESLGASADVVARGHALAQAREACLQGGGRAALAQCELDQSRRQALLRIAIDASGGPRGAYFGAAPSERFREEQNACAGLGLDPAGQAFAECVANLQASLFAADNPAQ